MKIRFAIALFAVFITANVLAQDRVTDLENKNRILEERIKELEQKIDKLGMDTKSGDYTKQLIQEYLDSPEAQEQMGVRAGYDHGFFVRSKELEFKFTGWLNVNANFYEDDTIDGVDVDGALENASASNTFWVKDARLQFHIYFYKHWHALVDIEATAGGGDLLRDAFIEYNCCDALNIRVGQFIAPFSVEAQEPEWDLLGIYASPIVQGAATFGPRQSIRDIGLMAYGFAFDYIGYAVALMNGNGRNAVDNNDDFHYFAQFRFYPFTTEHKRSFIHVAAMRGREGVRAAGANLATPWGWEVYDAGARIPFNEPENGELVIGALDTTAGWRTAVSFGFSIVKNDLPFRAQGEFIWSEFSRNRGVFGPYDQGGPFAQRRASRLQMWGFWLGFSYFIQVTDDPDTGIEPFIKFSYADVDDESGDYPGALGDAGLGHALDVRGQDLWCYTLGIRGHLNKHIRLDFNWIYAVPEHTDHLGGNAGNETGSISDKIDHSGGTMQAWLFQLQAKW
jgi:hypothetical protein